MENNITPQAISKYLKKYSSDKWKLYPNNDTLYNNIVVIPALDEYNNIQRLISSLKECDKKYFEETLFILVINNCKSTPIEAIENNKLTIDYLKSGIDDGSFKNSGLNISFIDASSDKYCLDDKNGGVGLARKIGMDIALTKFNYNADFKPIIICLDADCIVEANYISKIVDSFNINGMSAAFVNFRHNLYGNLEEQKAIVCYEIFLRYYVLGLKYAKSYYSYHSIGSTMICDAFSYVKIQGMNKRKAAEDFYFMEKLAKITPINKISCTCVYPSNRGSWRVPFGTGQRVNRYLSHVQNEYMLYNPESFEVLKEWLEIYSKDSLDNPDLFLEKTKEISSDIYKFLSLNNFVSDWTSIKQNTKTKKQLEFQKINWFDSFKTLKLIHYMRDNSFPMVSMFDALDKIFAKVGYQIDFVRKEEVPDLELQLKYLNILRELA